MSNFNSPRLYFGLVFLEIGWILDLVGIALEQSDIRYQRINPIGLQWYFLFVYLFMILLFNSAAYTNTIKTYRMLLLGLTVLSLAYIPFDIDAALHMQVDVNSYLSNVNPIKVVGLIIMAVSLFLILAVFGSDDNSYFNTFRVPIIGKLCTKPQPDQQENHDSDERQANEYQRPAFDRSQNEYSAKQEYKYPHSPVQEFPPPNSPRSYNQREPFRRDSELPPTPGNSISIPIKETDQSSVPPAVPPHDLSVLPSTILRNSSIKPDLLTKFKARAKYPYYPNPADSYQVPFHKDEIMDVVDGDGKW